MYTIELKNRIRSGLLNAKQTTLHSYVNNEKYIETHKIALTLQEVVLTTEFLPIGASWSERCFCILNDLVTIPKCYCGTTVKFIRYSKGYAEYCSVSCRAQSKVWQTQVANTNLEKYGVTHIAKLPTERIKRRIQLTNNRHNFDFSKASEKYRHTITQRYGYGHNPGWNQTAIASRIRNGNMVPIESRAEYKMYYSEVCNVTKQQPLHTLPNIQLRGVLNDTNNAHHVDHIYSIYNGYMNSVPACIVGHICNLQCIPAVSNIQKGNSITLTLKELYERYNKWVN